MWKTKYQNDIEIISQPDSLCPDFPNVVAQCRILGSAHPGGGYDPQIRTRPRFLHSAPTAPKFHHPMFSRSKVIVLECSPFNASVTLLTAHVSENFTKHTSLIHYLSFFTLSPFCNACLDMYVRQAELRVFFFLLLLTNKQTNKQTPLETSNALRYATTLGDNFISRVKTVLCEQNHF